LMMAMPAAPAHIIKIRIMICMIVATSYDDKRFSGERGWWCSKRDERDRDQRPVGGQQKPKSRGARKRMGVTWFPLAIE
jgi:hypothetical protein